MTVLAVDDPLAVAVTAAIRGGDVDRLGALLARHPDLARARLGDATESRSLLHVATDWPGHFANVAATIGLLVEAGAELDARFTGAHTETPLHWAASSDDVPALDALLDAGADPEVDGAVIAGGTPLADAVAFGQWKAAARLVERGAQANLWQAAGLGLMDEIEAAFAADPPPADEVANALWCAGHGGQGEAAAYLVARGGDPNRIGHDGLTPIGAARRSGFDDLADRLQRMPG